VNRIVLAKGIEFLLSLPVLVIFAIFSGAHLTWYAALFPLAIVLQAGLTIGLGLIVAPLVVFFRDLERVVRLILRFAFYASPIIYGTSDLPVALQPWAAMNPLTGLFDTYRSAFFAESWNPWLALTSVGWAAIVILIGMLVFRRFERSVLKEL
jgi:ABC-2 type transport system permease protein